MELQQLNKISNNLPLSPLMPLLFIGHGSPMNALEDNKFTASLNQVGDRIKANFIPTAVLCISAHWLTRGTFVNNAENPPTIHDFGGFPQALFDVQYPAAGSPQMAENAAMLVPQANLTKDWGLDHGAWSVLKHVFPLADIPVFQMSIDYDRPMSYHFNLASQLAALRNKGVLIVGSGNVVHNLAVSYQNLRHGDATPKDWAVEFDAWIDSKLSSGNWKDLEDYDKHPAGKLAAPTPDHYIPLLYTMGLAKPAELIQNIYQSVEYGGVSMRTFQVG